MSARANSNRRGLVRRAVGVRTQAFTLIEVLLAVAIFSIVLVAVHVVFHSALRLRERTTAKLAESLPLEHALSVIRRDLSAVTAPGGVLGAGVIDTESLTSSNVSALYGAEFYTTSGRLSAAEPWGEIQRVSYHLVESTNRTLPGRDLYRVVTRNLLPVFEEEPEQEWLLGGVEEIRVLFWSGYEWLESCSSAVVGATNSLPAAVKVEIELAELQTVGQGPGRALVELVVPLEMQPRTIAVATNETAGGGS